MHMEPTVDTSAEKPLFDLAEAFKADIRSRQRVWSHDRSKSLGASETFACLRRGWYEKFAPELKVERPLGMAERGNILEKHFVVPTLQRIFGNDNCLYMSDDQESFVLGQSSATPDGLVINQPRDILAKYGVDDIVVDHFVIEIKSFDPRANIHEEKTIHHGQAQMQLGMYHALTNYTPEYAIILYVNANDLEDVRPFVIKRDPKIFDVGRGRAERLYAASDAYDLRAEGSYTDQCKHCPFFEACRDAEVKRWPSDSINQSPEVVAEFAELAKQHEDARLAAVEAEATKKHIAESIKRRLAEVGTKGIDDPSYKITYSKLDGKESLDQDALNAFLKTVGKSTDDFLRAGGDYTRLVVTLRDPNRPASKRKKKEVLT